MGRLELTEDPVLEKLGDMDDAAARAEGFPDLPAFEAYWERMHGKWDPNREGLGDQVQRHGMERGGVLMRPVLPQEVVDGYRRNRIIEAAAVTLLVHGAALNAEVRSGLERRMAEVLQPDPSVIQEAVAGGLLNLAFGALTRGEEIGTAAEEWALVSLGVPKSEVYA